MMAFDLGLSVGSLGSVGVEPTNLTCHRRINARVKSTP